MTSTQIAESTNPYLSGFLAPVPKTCVHCGSDRLIRLSFSDPEADGGEHPDASGRDLRQRAKLEP